MAWAENCGICSTCSGERTSSSEDGKDSATEGLRPRNASGGMDSMSREDRPTRRIPVPRTSAGPQDAGGPNISGRRVKPASLARRVCSQPGSRDDRTGRASLRAGERQ